MKIKNVKKPAAKGKQGTGGPNNQPNKPSLGRRRGDYDAWDFIIPPIPGAGWIKDKLRGGGKPPMLHMGDKPLRIVHDTTRPAGRGNLRGISVSNGGEVLLPGGLTRGGNRPANPKPPRATPSPGGGRSIQTRYVGPAKAQVGPSMKDAEEEARREARRVAGEVRNIRQSIAPVAYAIDVPRTSAPTIRRTHNGTVIRHREYVSDIIASSGFNCFAVELNPANAETFRRASDLAGNYQFYKLRHIHFSYYKSCGTDQIGRVAMATTADAAMLLPTSKEELYNLTGCTASSPWQNMELRFNRNDMLGEYALGRGFSIGVNNTDRLGDTEVGFDDSFAAARDDRFESAGRMFFATTDCADDTTVLGELWVEYEFEFREPQDGKHMLKSCCVGRTAQSDPAMASTDLLGTATAPTNNSLLGHVKLEWGERPGGLAVILANPDLTATANQWWGAGSVGTGAIRFSAPGQFQLTYHLLGTGIVPATTGLLTCQAPAVQPTASPNTATATLAGGSGAQQHGTILVDIKDADYPLVFDTNITGATTFTHITICVVEYAPGSLDLAHWI